MSARIAIGLLIGLAAAGTAAASEPSACLAPAPAEGVTFSGPVLQVIDGERLCVALGPTPDTWVEVRPTGLTQISAMSEDRARSMLLAATFAKTLTCVAQGRVGDGVAAVCTVEGAGMTEQIKTARAQPGWSAWR